MKKAIRDKYIKKAKSCSLTLMDMQFMFPDMCGLARPSVVYLLGMSYVYMCAPLR